MSSIEMGNPLDHIPAMPPPDGQTSNLVNPPSNGPAVIVLNVVFMSLSVFAFIIRSYVRIILTTNWSWDDFACLLAVLCTIARTIFYFYQVEIGYGRHLWDIPVSWLIKPGVGQLLNADGIAYPLNLFFVKLSILLLYFRIFGIDRKLRLIIHITIAIITLFYATMLGTGIAGMFKCVNLEQSSSDFFCGMIAGQLIAANATFNFISDVWILSLPFPLIFQLHLRFRDKVGLAVVFATGLASCVASLARLIIEGITYRTTDSLWHTSYNVMCAAIETNTLIIVACVPCFPVFYRHTKPYLSSATNTLRRRLMTARGSSQDPSGKGVSAELGAKEVPEQAHFMPVDGGHTYIELHEPPPSWGHTAGLQREHV